MAALGSSFAAGPGIDPVADRAAMRSARNYAGLAAQEIGAELTDLTVSGATTATILKDPQVIAPGVQFEPQIHGLPADADVVTLTAGGNDLQFAGSMLYEGWLLHDPSAPLTALLAQGFADGIPAPTRERVTAMATGLCDVIRAVRAKAPSARVILVDYLTVIGAETTVSDAWPFDAAQTAAFRAIQDGIREGFALAAAETGAALLKASDLSVGHAVGSSDPWVLGFQSEPARAASAFHPNEHGMAAVARALVAML